MPISNEMWEKINLAHGWCWREKADRIYDIACEGFIQDAVEIGVFGGRSLLPLVAGIVPRGGRVTGYDIFEPHRTWNDNEQKWWDARDYAGLETSAKGLLSGFGFYGDHVIKLSSCDASKLYTDESIQYVHIDGAHCTWNAIEDIVLWSRRLSRNGWLLVDDTNLPELALPVEMLKHGDFEQIEVLKGVNTADTTIWRKK